MDAKFKTICYFNFVPNFRSWIIKLDSNFDHFKDGRRYLQTNIQKPLFVAYVGLCQEPKNTSRFEIQAFSTKSYKYYEFLSTVPEGYAGLIFLLHNLS
jgi:hypothetical protein